MKLIDKDALVAEIKRILSAFENSDASVDRLRASTLIALLSFIDTLEVKEVQEELASEDLEEAAQEYSDQNFVDACVEKTAFKAGARWQKSKLPKWKKTTKGSCWSGEIGVNHTKRKFEYEHYTINADKLFKLLEKEGRQ